MKFGRGLGKPTRNIAEPWRLATAGLPLSTCGLRERGERNYTEGPSAPAQSWHGGREGGTPSPHSPVHQSPAGLPLAEPSRQASSPGASARMAQSEGGTGPKGTVVGNWKIQSILIICPVAKISLLPQNQHEVLLQSFGDKAQSSKKFEATRSHLRLNRQHSASLFQLVL